MRKIVLLILSLSIFVGLNNFTYASDDIKLKGSIDPYFEDTIKAQFDYYKKAVLKGGLNDTDDEIMSVVYFETCPYYHTLKDYDTTIYCYKEGLETAKKVSINNYINMIDKLFSIYAELKDRNNGLYYLEERKKFTDSTDIESVNRLDKYIEVAKYMIEKSNNEICQEQYGANTYGDSKNCYCKTGYIWNTNQTSCIKEEKKETLKEAIEKQKEEIKNKDIENKTTDTFGLSDKQLKSINKSFDNIKNKLSKLVVEKRDATYKKLNTKIDLLLGKQKSEKNKNILKYLKSLVENEIQEIKWEEEGMTIDELLN